MNTKTMEGLAGAAASIQLTAVPMNAFREAQRKGNTEGMDRAMGYASGLMEQAGKYQEKAREGMKLEAEEARKEEKLAQEKLVEKRKAEKEAQENRMEESRSEGKRPPVDSVEISEEGREYVERTTGAGASPSVPSGSGEIPAGSVQTDFEAVAAVSVEAAGTTLDRSV